MATLPQPRPNFLISDLISEYMDVLESAVDDESDTGARFEYVRQLGISREMQAEYEASVALKDLENSVSTQLLCYTMASLPGPNAFSVGRAFGDLCRAVGVDLRPGIDAFR